MYKPELKYTCTLDGKLSSTIVYRESLGKKAIHCTFIPTIGAVIPTYIANNNRDFFNFFYINTASSFISNVLKMCYPELLSFQGIHDFRVLFSISPCSESVNIS